MVYSCESVLVVGEYIIFIYLAETSVADSKLQGSLGTLLLDMVIFAQFFLYRKKEEEENLEER